MPRIVPPLVALALACAAALPVAAAPVAPTGFVAENAFPGLTFDTPTRVAFLPDGRALVAEKRGTVWIVSNGVRSANPLVSLDAEVLNANDRGLLSVAVHPNYFVNHWIYLLYTVDPDGDNVETNSDAFSRLTRYTVNFTDSSSVVAGSRTVLIGTNWAGGIVSASSSHTIGDLQWGADGSLLVSAGDGASFTGVDAGGQHPGCFTSGRTNSYEDIGAYRSQSLTSLAGKILRIDPATGLGYPSNPFWDGNGASVRSRVYAYGLRNPYRFTVRPGSGAADPALGNPGVLFVGDVGWETWEEQNVATAGGRNFGWPCREGAAANTAYTGGAQPAHNGCGSTGTSDNPSAFTAPDVYYNHASNVASVPPGFFGNTATGGVFYTRTQYPAAYRNQYVCADYGQSWIRLATVNASHHVTAMSSFITGADGPVGLTLDPVSGDVLYVAILTGEVRRIRYTAAGGNRPPVANATGAPVTGAAPLTVSFSSAGTSDPDGDAFTLSWSFGDGSNSAAANPSHVYGQPGVYAAVLTATDTFGNIGRDTVSVSVTGTAAPFPSTAVLDNFNRANGAIGASWLDQAAGLVVNANQLAQNVTDNTVVWNGGPYGADQEAYFTLAQFNAAAEEHDLMLKVQGTSWAAGHIEVHVLQGGGAITVNTYAPGQGWVGRGTLSGFTIANGDRIGARARANGDVEVWRNGVQLGTVNVGNWPYASSGGRIGMTLVGLGRLDDFGGGNVVTNANTPPTAHITAPANGTFYIAPQTVPLTCDASDAQTPPAQLAFRWDVLLHHNNHLHPGLTFTTQNASFPTDNHDDGTGVFYRVMLAVTDAGGLTARDSVDLWPENDLVTGPITVTPAAPLTSDSLTYRFAIRNAGRLPAQRSRWRLVRGATLVAEGDTVVAALDSVVIVQRTASLAAGTYTLRAVADTLGVVHELSETNNASTRALAVTSPVNHAPVARLTATPASGSAPLTVAFSGATSTDPDNDPLTYAWVFGDGGTAAGVSANHVYAAAGTYTAALTVNDGRGGTNAASTTITATAVTATFPSTPVLDNFNRANGAIGGSWLDQTTGLVVNTNQLAQNVTDNTVVWNGGPFGADQEAYFTLAQFNASAEEHDLMLKVQGTSWSSGHIEIHVLQGGSAITVNTYAPTQGWVGRGSLTGFTLASGDRIGARARPNGTVDVWRNATLLGSVSVSGWPYTALGGRIGMTLVGLGRLDDFGGGTTAGTPASPASLAPGAGDGGGLALAAPHPNPSRLGVTLALDCPVEGALDVQVFDVGGREIWSDRAWHAAGPAVITWTARASDGQPVRPGIYLVRARLREQTATRRVVIVP